jgi:hypothetical protein
MVTTLLPEASLAAIEHERTGTPSTCTVQAPHCATPQPNFGPTMLRSSRRTQSSGFSGSTSTWRTWPLAVNEIIVR